MQGGYWKRKYGDKTSNKQGSAKDRGTSTICKEEVLATVEEVTLATVARGTSTMCKEEVLATMNKEELTKED